MQQLVIKLSPEATENYLKMTGYRPQATMDLDQSVSGVQLDINMSLMSGLCFADIDVNGQSIKTSSDEEDLQLELIEVN